MKIYIYNAAYGTPVLTIECHNKTYEECCKLGQDLIRTGLFKDCDYEVEKN